MDDTVREWAGGDFVLPEFEPGGVILCGACTRLGHCRLGVTIEELQPDGSVRSELICGEEHEGGPGVAHGGWTAGVLDELVGHLPLLNGCFAVTGTLTVRFGKPVPIGVPLLATARLDRREGSRWYVTARICLAVSGAELAVGEGVLVERDRGHFARHERWLADQTPR